MADSFFIKPNSGTTSGTSRGEPQRKKLRAGGESTKKTEIDEELTSSDDESVHSSIPQEEVDPYAHETADEKRVRLAKQALKAIEEEIGYSDEVAIGDRLREDAYKRSDRYVHSVAASISSSLETNHCITSLRGHKLPVTCVTVTPDSKTIYTGSKDCCVIRWDPELGRKVAVYGGHRVRKNRPIGSVGSGHSHHVLAVATSSDGRIVVSGGLDGGLHIWDTRQDSEIEVLHGHRGPISALSFQRGTDTLFSASYDRTVRVWSIGEMACLDTLFGHQDEVISLDASVKERCVTGGRDGTARVWKVPEQTSLLFRPSGQCIGVDCVAYCSDQRFISGGDDGQLSMWSTFNKKPQCSVPLSHGPPGTTIVKKTAASASTATSMFLDGLGVKSSNKQSKPITITTAHTKPNWISSVAGYWGSDLVASGSCDGHVRFWGCREQPYVLESMGKVRVDGWVNGMQFSDDGSFIALAVGQEHRLGRWSHVSSARNSLSLLTLSLSDVGEGEEEMEEEEEAEMEEEEED